MRRRSLPWLAVLAIASGCASNPRGAGDASTADRAHTIQAVLDGADLDGFELGGTPDARHRKGVGCWERAKPGPGLLLLRARARGGDEVAVLECALGAEGLADPRAIAAIVALTPGPAVAWMIRPGRSSLDCPTRWNTVALHRTNRPEIYVGLEGSGERWGVVLAKRIEDLALVDAHAWPGFERTIQKELDLEGSGPLDLWLIGDESDAFRDAYPGLRSLRERVAGTIAERRRARVAREIAAQPRVLQVFSEPWRPLRGPRDPKADAPARKKFTAMEKRYGLALRPERLSNKGQLYDEVFDAELPKLGCVVFPAIFTEIHELGGAFFGRSPELGPTLVRLLDGSILETPFVRVRSPSGALEDAKGRIYDVHGNLVFEAGDWPPRSQRLPNEPCTKPGEYRVFLADSTRRTTNDVREDYYVLTLASGRKTFATKNPKGEFQPVAWISYRDISAVSMDGFPSGSQVYCSRWLVVNHDGSHEILRFPGGASPLGRCDEIQKFRHYIPPPKTPDLAYVSAFGNPQSSWWILARRGTSWTPIRLPDVVDDDTTKGQGERWNVHYGEPPDAPWTQHGSFPTCDAAKKRAIELEEAWAKEKGVEAAQEYARREELRREQEARIVYAGLMSQREFDKAYDLARPRGEHDTQWELRALRAFAERGLDRLERTELRLVKRGDFSEPDTSGQEHLTAVEEACRSLEGFLASPWWSSGHGCQAVYGNLLALRSALGGEADNRYTVLRFDSIPTDGFKRVEKWVAAWAAHRDAKRRAEAEEWAREAAARERAAAASAGAARNDEEERQRRYQESVDALRLTQPPPAVWIPSGASRESDASRDEGYRRALEWKIRGR